MEKTTPKGDVERWLCACECGTQKVARKYDLLNGDVKSCGCFRREFAAQQFTRHGHTKGLKRSPEHTSWSKLIERCENPKCELYAAYGAKGIAVCDRWKTFENFFADMGARPFGTSIDRIDNSKGYEPGNCRWATRRVQAQNRSVARMITYDGECMNMVEWARRLGMKPSTLSQRINGYGWSVERAFTQGVKART